MLTKSTSVLWASLLLTLANICQEFLTTSDFIGVISAISDLPLTNYCAPFSSLDEALIDTARFKQSFITLTDTPSKSILLGNANVSSEVYIEGSGNEITIDSRIEIHIGGSLTMKNITVRDSLSTVSGFEIEGKLMIVKCVFENWKSGLFRGMGAVLLINQSTFKRNNKTIIEMTNCELLEISLCNFEGNSGLIRVENGPSAISASMRVFENVFRGNAEKTLISVLHSAAKAISPFQMSFNTFSNNSALILDLNLNGFPLILQSEYYSDNTAGGIQLKQKNGISNIQNCTWTNNDYPFLSISHLNGSILVSDSIFTHQKQSAPIHINNIGDFLTCQITLLQSHFANYQIQPQFQTAGAIFTSKCSVFLYDSTLENCTVASLVLSETYGVIAVRQSYLVVARTTFEKCGGSGAVFAYILSTSMLEQITISNAKVGMDAVFIIVGSKFTAKGLSMINASSTRGNLVNIFAEMSQITVSTLTIEHNGYPYKNSFSAFYSFVRCDNFQYRNFTGFSAFSLVGSEFTLESSVCQNCALGWYAQGQGGSIVTYRNLTLSDSIVENGVWRFGGDSHFLMSNLLISDSNVEIILCLDWIVADIYDLRVINSRVRSVMYMILQSNVTMRSVRFLNSSGGLVSFSSGSTIVVSDAVFDRMESDEPVLSLKNSDMRIEDSRFVGVKSQNFAMVSSLSILTFRNVSISDITAKKREIMVILSSELVINQSEFDHFHATLIYSESSGVTIENSRFENGGFRADRKYGSQSRKGGMLHCINCAHINLNDIQVSDVSADIGGAIYCEAIEQSSALIIYNSSFEGCSAYMGGAAVISNVSFDIQLSDFNGCFSESFGGALDLTVSETHFRSIKSTRFIYNSAYEGGAIKWRNAETIIENCIFFNNSAYYGPDIASYAINLSTSLPVSIPPGQPITLNFDLVDYYQQKVTTIDSDFLSFISTSNVRLSGVTTKIALNGTFNFTDIAFFTLPGSIQTIHTQYIWKYQDSTHKSDFYYEVHFRDCFLGEIRTTNSCKICNIGYFSMNSSDNDCNICPQSASCPGGSIIIPHNGYWLTSVSDSPVLECLISNNCIWSNQSVCTAGHTGILCNKCAEGWFASVFFACSECPHAAVIIVEFLLTCSAFMVVLYGILRFSIVKPNAISLFLLKSSIAHVQLLSLFAFLRISYPPTLQYFFRISLDLATLLTASFPFQCFGLTYYYNVGAAAISSLIAFTLAGLLIAGRCVYYRKCDLFRKEFHFLIPFLCWFVPVTITISNIPVLICVKIGGGKEGVLVDLEQECWVESHFLVAVAVLVPSFVCNFAALIAGKIFMMKFKTFSVYSFEYTKNWCEFVSFFCKIILISAVLLQISDPIKSQIFVGLLLFYIISLFYGSVGIFKDVSYLLIMQTSNFILIATYSLLITYLEFDSFVGESLITAMILVLNFVFFVICCVHCCLFSRKNQRIVQYQIDISGEEMKNSETTGLRLQGIHIEVSRIIDKLE